MSKRPIDRANCTEAQIQLNKSLTEFKRLYIDIGDYRKKRQEKVRELAMVGVFITFGFTET